MVWGCFSASGVWDFNKIDKKLISNTENYDQSVFDEAVLFGKHLIDCGFIFINMTMIPITLTV